jgi:hypothetical protein
MKRKFELAGKEFWIEVISISALNHCWPFAKHISASTLKQLLQQSDVKQIKITNTMPDVYIVLGSLLLKLPYRPFLTFASQLYEVEDNIKINWLRDGF